MWLTKTWVLLFAACSNSGSGDQTCTYHYADGFVSRRMCEADGVPVTLEVQCAISIPDREA